MNFFHDNYNRRVSVLAYLFIILITPLSSQDCDTTFEYIHPIEYAPRVYNARHINENLKIDGKLAENDWLEAEYSQNFIDIEGSLKPIPERKTQIKMLWDESYLYIGVLMEEDHLWYTLTEKDAIMFHDDDFEVFIDADGNGHNYQEFEMNQYNALWDLWMLHPYYLRKGRNYIMEWEAKGIKTAVYLNGSVNNASDIDSFWSVEMAIPLKLLGQASGHWRINFSRVDWIMDIVDGEYVKRKGEPERNWVWSPTGFVNMHKPETWGYLIFKDEYEIPPIEDFKWEMWKVYHALKDYHHGEGRYPETVQCFKRPSNIDIEINYDGFDIIGSFNDEIWILNEMALLKKMK